MAVTETSTESWGSRLGNSIKGVVIGGVLFIAGIPLLFWNEGRSVKTTQALEEGAANCVAVPSADTIDAANEGKLIHVTGTAKTDDVLTDDIFSGISIKGMRLSRTVEYYQWVENEKKEKKKNLGGSETTTTTYTYSKKWVSRPEDSSEFKEAGHENVVHFADAENETKYAQQATLGAFSLTPRQIHSISGQEAVKLEGVELPETLKGRTALSGNTLYIGKASNPMLDAIRLKGEAPQLPVAPAYVNIETEPGQNLYLLETKDGIYVQSSKGDMYPLEGDEEADTLSVRLPNGGTRSVTNYGDVTEPAPTVGYPLPAAVNVERMGERPVVCVGKFVYIVTEDNRYLVVKPWENHFVVTDHGIMKKVDIILNNGTGTSSSVDPGAPQIGDVRITWNFVGAEKPVSIVAVQTGNTFSPYVAKSSGYKVDLLENGIKNKELMFQNAEDGNTMWTWILRFIGWFIMYIGLKMIFNPITVLADVLPILGDIAGIGLGVVAFLISTAVALVVIAIAWLFYRPVLGIILLAAAVGLLVLLIKKKAAAKAAKAAAAPAPAAE